MMAYELGDANLHAKVTYRHPALLETPANGSAAVYTPTTVGRILFNSVLPDDFRYINEPIAKGTMGDIVDTLARDYPKAVVSSSLDGIKDICYRYATQSGLTVSIDDVKTPETKRGILDAHEKDAEKVETQFRRGIITDGELSLIHISEPTRPY